MEQLKTALEDIEAYNKVEDGKVQNAHDSLRTGPCSRFSDSSSDDSSDGTIFEEDERPPRNDPLRALVREKLYTAYKSDQNSIAALQGLSRYYYTDYLSIVKLLSQSQTALHSSKLLKYIQNFQQAAKHYLQGDIVNTKKVAYYKESLQSLFSSNSNEKIYNMVAELGGVLGALTGQRLESAISHAASKKINDVESYAEYIASIFTAIKAWDAFLEELVPLYGENNIGAKEYYSYLYKLSIDLKIVFDTEIIQPITPKTKELNAFVAFVANVHGKDVADFTILAEEIQIYKKIFEGIQVLNAIPAYALDPALTENFHNASDVFENFCLAFFEQQSIKLLSSFKTHISQNTKQRIPADPNGLYKKYKELNKVFNAWSDFLQWHKRLSSEKVSLMEKCEEQKACVQSTITESPFALLEALLFLFGQFSSESTEHYPSFEDIQEKFIIRQSIKDILRDNPSSQIQFIKKDYEKRLNSLEEKFKEYCLQLQEKFTKPDETYIAKPPAAPKNKRLPLQKMLAIRNYHAAIQEFSGKQVWRDYDRFIQLCETYGDSSWVLSQNHPALSNSLGSSTPKLR